MNASQPPHALTSFLATLRPFRVLLINFTRRRRRQMDDDFEEDDDVGEDDEFTSPFLQPVRIEYRTRNLSLIFPSVPNVMTCQGLYLQCRISSRIWSNETFVTGSTHRYQVGMLQNERHESFRRETSDILRFANPSSRHAFGFRISPAFFVNWLFIVMWRLKTEKHGRIRKVWFEIRIDSHLVFFQLARDSSSFATTFAVLTPHDIPWRGYESDTTSLDSLPSTTLSETARDHEVTVFRPSHHRSVLWYLDSKAHCSWDHDVLQRSGLGRMFVVLNILQLRTWWSWHVNEFENVFERHVGRVGLRSLDTRDENSNTSDENSTPVTKTRTPATKLEHQWRKSEHQRSNTTYDRESGPLPELLYERRWFRSWREFPIAATVTRHAVPGGTLTWNSAYNPKELLALKRSSFRAKSKSVDAPLVRSKWQRGARASSSSSS